MLRNVVPGILLHNQYARHNLIETEIDYVIGKIMEEELDFASLCALIKVRIYRQLAMQKLHVNGRNKMDGANQHQVVLQIISHHAVLIQTANGRVLDSVIQKEEDSQQVQLQEVGVREVLLVVIATSMMVIRLYVQIDLRLI